MQVVIGPATVGGIQAGAFKIGDTAGTIETWLCWICFQISMLLATYVKNYIFI